MRVVQPTVEMDWNALGSLAFAAWEQSQFGEQDAGRCDREKLFAEFCSFCRDKSETMLVATIGDVCAGWGAREFSDNIISDLWVAPFAQGQGVGAALLAALEEVIANAGYTFVELETSAGNAGAVRFYERHGYIPVWRGMKFSASLNYELEKIRFRKALPEAA
jgi:ribosomal-protein-alanine N-acetyltransferase